ncbi:MAG: hypothetical protein ABSA57_22070 [Candidatus Acidiferrales bacterium]
MPVVIFLSEDNEWCATAGDRTINRYRAMTRRKIDPLCLTGIVAPEREGLDATLGDWVNEVERVQLMLRLTPDFAKNTKTSLLGCNDRDDTRFRRGKRLSPRCTPSNGDAGFPSAVSAFGNPTADFRFGGNT